MCKETRMRFPLIAVSAAAALLATYSHAEERARSTMPEIVVTATRFPQTPEELVRPVTVITAEEIARSGQQSLVEILQARGDVEISRNGGYGQVSSVFIRGANANHTLVLVDGLRVSSATTGATAFENIPVNQIDRIEILPGPASGLYGSDAIGGVIQIFTRSGRGTPTKYISAGAGSYNTRSVSAGISTTLGGTELAVHVGHFTTDGFSATKPTVPFGQHNPDKDGYRNTNVSAKLAQHFGTDHELGLTLFQSEGRTWFDAGPATDDVSDQTLAAYSIYSRNRITPRWESLVRLGEGRDRFTSRGMFPGTFNTRQPQITWQNNVRIGPGTAVAGLEYLEQKIESTRAFAQTSRDVKSAFAGYIAEYGAHALQVNGRHDDSSQFGSHDTGNVAYGYRITPALRARAGVGTAFKAPSFNDLYFPGFSNPDLRPERSKSREAGLDYQLGAQRFSATYFDNRIADLIVFDLGTFTLQNLNRARIRGTQLGYQVTWQRFYANAKATFQDPENEANGRLLPRRARKHGTVAAGYGNGPWSVGAELVASSERYDGATESPATRMHGYGLVNLTAAYAFKREWTVRARWNNVTDRDYELAQHFNTPGSNVFVAVQYQPR